MYVHGFKDVRISCVCKSAELEGLELYDSHGNKLNASETICSVENP